MVGMAILLENLSKISLSFLLASSTHKRTLCRRICFFDVFYIFFKFSKKKSQNGEHGCSLKGVEFFKTINGFVKQSLIVYLKMIFGKFQSKLSHICSLNWNYFRKINIKSFKCAKLGRNRENSKYLGIIYPIWTTLCDNWMGTILHHIFSTCFTKKSFLAHRK